MKQVSRIDNVLLHASEYIKQQVTISSFSSGRLHVNYNILAPNIKINTDDQKQKNGKKILSEIFNQTIYNVISEHIKKHRPFLLSKS